MTLPVLGGISGWYKTTAGTGGFQLGLCQKQARTRFAQFKIFFRYYPAALSKNAN
jgi:hypothetical protein